MEYAKYASTMYSYTANPKRSSSVTSDKYSSAFALRTSLSTPSKPSLVSQRSNTSLTSSPRQAPRSPPENPRLKKGMLQFIGLANYFLDHGPRMTEMVKPLRDMIPLGKYQRTGKLIWTTESSAAFKFCHQAISNCQELYFLEDTATPILQTDASDCSIGGYLYMVTNGKVRVIRFFSKALTGTKLGSVPIGPVPIGSNVKYRLVQCRLVQYRLVLSGVVWLLVTLLCCKLIKILSLNHLFCDKYSTIKKL